MRAEVPAGSAQLGQRARLCPETSVRSWDGAWSPPRGSRSGGQPPRHAQPHAAAVCQPQLRKSSATARGSTEAPKRDKDKAAAVGKGQARLPYRRRSSAERQESKTAKCLKLELPNPSWGSLERSPGPGALGERHKRQRRGRDGKGAWGPRQVERGTAGAGAAASPLPPSHPTACSTHGQGDARSAPSSVSCSPTEEVCLVPVPALPWRRERAPLVPCSGIPTALCCAPVSQSQSWGTTNILVG